MGDTTDTALTQATPTWHKPTLGFFFLVVMCTFWLGCSNVLAAPLNTVRLQLKWQHQFQFAGYYAALEKGFYRNAGLDVVITPSEPGIDPTRNVLDGKAEFGVGTTDLLLLREKGEPVVVLAAIFQHSPLALMTLATPTIQTLHDLAGRRLMIETGSSELLAYLRREGIPENRFTSVSHDFSSRELVTHKIDGMSVYTTDEPFDLTADNQPYILYSPRSGGIDFYGDNLFTTEQQIAQHPQRVRAFRAASVEGWKYAMAHPDEIARLIYQRYSQRHSLAHLQFEAKQMVPLLNSDLVEPGHMYAGRWQHIAAVYAELGVLKPDFNLGGFLYDPSPVVPDQSWFYVISVALLTLLLVAIATIVYIFKINQRFRVSNQRWNQLFHTSPLAIVVFDEFKKVIAWNRAATSIFGWTEQEALGRNMLDLLVPESEQAHVQRVLNESSSANPTQSVNANHTKSGSIITCEWHNTSCYDQDGDMSWSISLAADVSDRMVSQQRLSQAKDMAEQLLADQKQFFSMVSHEFRSPLSVIDSAAQVLQLRCEEECGSSEVIRRVRRGVRRLAGFVDNCLAEDRLGRIGQEGVVRREKMVALRPLLESAVNQVALDSPRHYIHFLCPADINSFKIDPELLAIVIVNLLGNACKYSSPGSSVWLRVVPQSDGALLFSVEDEGVGIEAAEIDKVCQRYYRGSNTASASGVGLGLFLVDRIVTQYRGQLKITSQIGVGTTMHVRLPPAEVA